MKTIVNSWFWVLLLCATLGLAPYSPEPHLWGKIRWIDGGAVGMKPLDWWDFIQHTFPWLLLSRLIFLKFFDFWKRRSRMAG